MYSSHAKTFLFYHLDFIRISSSDAMMQQCNDEIMQ
jgi:hypothetical protein